MSTGRKIKLAFQSVALQPSSLAGNVRKIYYRKLSHRLSLTRRDFEKNQQQIAGPIEISLDSVLEYIGARLGVLVVDKSDCRLSIGVNSTDLTFAKRLIDNLILPSGKRNNSDEWTFKSPDGSVRKIYIQAYDRRDKSIWVSRAKKNRIIRAVYSDIFKIPKITYAADLLGGAHTIYERIDSFDVDVVYTWVNSDDENWQAMFNKYSKTKHKSTSSKTDSSSMTRFNDNDELFYSLRSVNSYLPWVRNIYIVTNCAPPKWLCDHPKVKVVQHEDIIPKEYLPCFSSHAIEACLHRIPDLSEHFIYINDDVFIGKYLSKSFFFDEALRSRSYMEDYAMVSGEVKIGDPDYLNASRNSQRLINQEFGVSVGQLHRHTSFALKKSILEKIEKAYKSEIEQTRSNRFRASTDVNLTSFLYHHYANLSGEGLFSICHNEFIKSTDPQWPNKLKKMKKMPEILCLNEGGVTNSSPLWRESVSNFLAAKFPDPAPWEKLDIQSDAGERES